MTVVLQLADVHKNYLLGKSYLQALKDIHLIVEKGDFLAIAGPSGSGKSTLLNIIGGIDKPDAGKILFNGELLSLFGEEELTRFRRKHLGFIFQSFNLIPILTAYENVEYPLILNGVAKTDRKARVIKAMEKVGLGTHLHHRPLELSGGQQQRVAIARALVNEPLLVLADEPTANLDSKTGKEILDLMQRINKERQVTFIFSTHDAEVMQRANRVVHIHDGAIVERK